MSDYISKSAVTELIESKMTDGCLGTEDETFVDGHGLVDDISDLPTLDEKEIIRKAFERIVERLEERTEFLKDCTKYGNKNAKQQEHSYSTMMMYEVADLVDDLIEICKEEGGISE